jgi:hypothetical protein
MSAGNETFHVCMRMPIATLAADEVRWYRCAVAAGQWGLMRLMATSKCYQISGTADFTVTL